MMHWVIQDNLYREDGYTKLAEALQRLSIPHDVVKVIPFTSDLSFDQQLEPAINPTNPTMVCGSTTLDKIAQARGWQPGSFLNENHDYRVWREHYGNHLLNTEAQVCRFADVRPIWSPMFIRPVDGVKSFAGKVMDWPEFVEWQVKVIDLKETYTTLDADTMVMYSPVQRLMKEFRFFVVDRKIVGESVYKIGSRVVYDPLVDREARWFAYTMTEIWNPARAYVLDVAMTEMGMKVIEINCINSAGFYAIDVMSFVMAIENMRGL